MNTYKYPKFFLLFVMIVSLKANAQSVGINTAAPDTSAILDISSTTKGLLIPRMTTAQQTAISLPASSLMIFNTTENQFKFNSGTPSLPGWETVLTGKSAWSTVGNNGLPAANSFIGTTDNIPLRFRTNNINRISVDTNGNVGIGTITPAQKFHVIGTDTGTSVIAATTNILAQFENINLGSTCLDLKAINNGHTLSTRIGINPTYNLTGGNGMMAWYANYDGIYRIINGYDYVNNNYLIAPAVPGYTVSKVGINLAQATLGSVLTVSGGLAVSNGSSPYSTVTAPQGGALFEGSVGFGTTAPLSSIDVNGSSAAAITTISNNITLDATHYTVIITSGTPTITLPLATACNRRIYNLVNQTNSTRTISSYKNFSGSNTTSIASASAIVLQSNGSSWYQIK